MSTVAPESSFVAQDIVARVSPFGVRFWDPSTSRFVADGLVVTVTWDGGRKRRPAVQNRASVFVVAGLPELRDLEFGDHDALVEAGAKPGDDDYWRIVRGLARAYTIEVVDTLGRFLPFTFAADLPFRGLFEPLFGSPLASPPGSGLGAVPLYAAPARSAPPGHGAVRAQLTLAGTKGTPAAWALVEVTAGTAPSVRGLADGKGRVAVLVPYPEPSSTGGSPPSGRLRPLAEERWPVHVHCFYDGSSPASAPPDLQRVLEQPPVLLELDASPPGAALELRFGQDLVLRTPGHSDVLVTPAASPP